jgi:hypothetical protein
MKHDSRYMKRASQTSTTLYIIMFQCYMVVQARFMSVTFLSKCCIVFLPE